MNNNITLLSVALFRLCTIIITADSEALNNNHLIVNVDQSRCALIKIWMDVTN
jgi:hypothetical protein